MKKNYNICIEAFIRWEQLTGKTFDQIDFADLADVHRLLYCAYLINDVEFVTFEVFEHTLKSNRRLYRDALKQLERYNAMTAQFSALASKVAMDVDDRDKTAEIALKERKNNAISIGEVSARLIVSGGLDARYVMREMTIEDMVRYIRAMEDKQRQELESARLWTYLTILPHIDKKKLNSPQKLVVFPWEKEATKKAAQRVAEEMKDEFERFMQQTPR